MFKRYREHFARKNSRANNLEDVFRRTSVCGDPIIQKTIYKRKRNTHGRKKNPIPKDSLALLKPTTPYQMK